MEVQEAVVAEATSPNHAVDVSAEALEAKGMIRIDPMDVQIVLVMVAWDLHQKTWACRILITNP